ncbi:unnamed protein product [Nezara viridula]|uniref:Uncharacterized protein n=1 Tax=Nezara viridula TaxID=85310 RepID=A0A9P0H9Q2_NEZVI|nr:unnamed protein product [Nezara viridula]
MHKLREGNYAARPVQAIHRSGSEEADFFEPPEEHADRFLSAGIRYRSRTPSPLSSARDTPPPGMPAPKQVQLQMNWPHHSSYLLFPLYRYSSIFAEVAPIPAMVICIRVWTPGGDRH